MIRWLIASAGIGVGAYGGWLWLSRQNADQVLDAGLWLVSGVLLHDVALSVVVVLAALALGPLPRAAHAPAAGALVVVGTLTIVAFPVLGGFGKRADNPTHLDRPYLADWLGVVVVTVGIVVVTALVRARNRED